MKALSNKQWILIAGAFVLSVSLYLAPRKGSVEKKTEEHPKEAAIGEDFIAKINSSLSNEDQQTATKFLAGLKTATGNKRVQVLDSLGSFYDRKKEPAAAASFYEEIAGIEKTEKAWINAAYRYFDGFKAIKDSLLRPVLVQKAIYSYSKALEINPTNLNVKTDLGICYTETSQPMKGILLLKAVTTENPNHENAQMNLGLLSMKSGQYDKAIDRFLKVIEINPSRSEIYLYLGESYLQKEQKKEAIQYFEKYVKVNKDPEMVSRIQEYIKELKRS